jgi:uncharacterized membrane protein YphA (DoxX/SURF4 family)
MNNTALWIMQGILAAMFIMPGYMKVTSPAAKVREMNGMAPGASIIQFRLLGWLEWLGVIGIIVPWLTGIAPILTPITAVCFAIVMVGAAVMHGQKKDYKVMPLLAVIFILSVIVAYYRF